MAFGVKAGLIAVSTITLLGATYSIAGYAAAQQSDDPNNIARLGEWQSTSRVNTISLNGTVYQRDAAIANGYANVVARFETQEHFACHEPIPLPAGLEGFEIEGLNLANCQLARNVDGPLRRSASIACPFDGRSGATARWEQTSTPNAVVVQFHARSEFQAPDEPRTLVALDTTETLTRVGDCH